MSTIAVKMVKDRHYTIYCANAFAWLGQRKRHSIHAVVTDPPYGLGKQTPVADLMRAWVEDDDHDHLAGSGGFMGRAWDAMVPHPRIWREVCRVLKPGGHVVCFAGQRTADLMAGFCTSLKKGETFKVKV